MTESDRIRPLGVSDKQSIAIDALVSGALQWEAAEKAGVQRTTVTAWCNHHIAFKAERNQRRQDRTEAAGEQLQETLSTTGVQLGHERDVVLAPCGDGAAMHPGLLGRLSL